MLLNVQNDYVKNKNDVEIIQFYLPHMSAAPNFLPFSLFSFIKYLNFAQKCCF